MRIVSISVASAAVMRGQQQLIDIFLLDPAATDADFDRGNLAGQPRPRAADPEQDAALQRIRRRLRLEHPPLAERAVATEPAQLHGPRWSLHDRSAARREAQQRAVADAGGGALPEQAIPAGSDLRLYAAAGVPTLHYGPGDLNLAHGPMEKVPVAEVVTATRAFALLTLRTCGVR